MTIIDTKELRRRLARPGREYLLDHEGAVLHVWEPTPFERSRAPLCFRTSRKWGHLFTRDASQLVELGRAYGIAHPLVHRKGRNGQHIDLCGEPLRRVMEDAEGND